VQQQNQRASALLEAGLQDVHSQQVNVGHEAGSYPGRNDGIGQGRNTHFISWIDLVDRL
jgi:hypothetical protein